MKGASFSTTEDKKGLVVTIDTLVFSTTLDKEAFLTHIANTEFQHFYVSNDKLMQLSEAIAQAADQQSMDAITMTIGELERPKIETSLSDDKMEASITIEVLEGEPLPRVADVVKVLKQNHIMRGISTKRISQLLQSAADADVGTVFNEVVAKGLPPRKGKDSYIKPLVPNAIDRVLAPVDRGDNTVDMRNLGDVLCVTKDQAIAERIAPGGGRNGFTVTNKKLRSKSGEWQKIKLGDNVSIDKRNENSVIATLAGQPKFENEVMSVDDTYVCDGVNVGTGNIKYEGAVIVNGDVTENMQIEAEGDVTINGFVESAMIRSGGDIIITQGATGKMNDEDCQLFANGSIFVEHGQGLDVVAGKNLHIAKQLAYSRVKCRGTVNVGDKENPMGNLFASTINCFNSVRAGSVGAVSGSELTIDFSEGYTLILNRIEALSNLFKVLSTKNADHEIKLAAVRNRHIPEALQEKIGVLFDELDSERKLLEWLRISQQALLERKLRYEDQAKVIANKELFPGVMVKMNKKLWKSEKECQRCRIILENDDWVYQPIV